MRKILVLSILVLGCCAIAQVSAPVFAPQGVRLSPEQLDVWNGELRHFQYLNAKDLSSYMSLWDNRFVGWPDYQDLPVRKQEIERAVRPEMQISSPALPMPLPQAVEVFGSVAVTHYFWPDADQSSKVDFRITHTWQKGPQGWHIISGLSCEVPRKTGGASSGPENARTSIAADSAEVAAVKSQEEAFRQAELKYDREAAKNILAEEFTIVGNHGERLNRPQFVDMVADNSDPLEILEYGDLQVRVYGETALVRSTIHERAIYGGKPDEYRGLRSAMWVKRDGRWQCVLIQTSASEESK